jgi:hypothetical protein
LKAQKLLQPLTDSAVLRWRPVVAAWDLELPNELYLTTQVESRGSYCAAMGSLSKRVN